MAWTTPQTVVADSTELTAALWNEQVRDNTDYLKTVSDQGHRILTTAQRDALTGVTAGTMIYNSTLGQSQSYDGSNWVGVSGLVPVIATGYTTPRISIPAGSTVVDIDGAFTSAYDNYRIVLENFQQSAAFAFQWQFRTASGPVTAGNYSYAYYTLTYTGGAATSVASGTTQVDLYGSNTGAGSMRVIDIMRPNINEPYVFAYQTGVNHHSGSTVRMLNGMFGYSGTIQATGFRLWPGSGTWSGTLTIYGYSKV